MAFARYKGERAEFLWGRQTIELSFVCGCEVLERKLAIGVGLVGDQWGP